MKYKEFKSLFKLELKVKKAWWVKNRKRIAVFYKFKIRKIFFFYKKIIGRIKV